jgi:gas vesicle protein
MSKQPGSFFLAGLLGAVAGAVGGLLLAPQSGKATRKDIVKLANDISKKIKTESVETKNRVKEVFGNVTDGAVAKYNEIKDAVVAKLAALKTAGTAIDKDKYAKVVDDVVAEFKSDFEDSKSGATKIASYLKKDWDKVKKALA